MTIPILTIEMMRAAEAEADEAGLSYAEMMNRAGQALASRLAQLLRESAAPPDQWRVTFLIGPGNNGGDGLIAGRLLAAETSATVHFYLLKARPESDPHLQAAQADGLIMTHAQGDRRFHTLQQMVSSSLIIVDALFGTGTRLPLDAETRKLLTTVKRTLDAEDPASDGPQFIDTPVPARPQRTRVLAVDCPSGLNCDSGALDDAALQADETVTMIAAKPGLFLFPGAAATGRLQVADLGVATTISGLERTQQRLITPADVIGWLPKRSPDSHKGTYGHVLVIGGSANYIGAPALSAHGAYRMGAGLVTLGMPSPLVNTLAGGFYEGTWLHLPHDLGALNADGAGLARREAAKCDALVIGMGIGREAETRNFLLSLLTGEHAQAHAPIGFSGAAPIAQAQVASLPPLIIDADGLALLAEIPNWPSLLPADTVLTPHAGEMARLCGLAIQDVIEQRWELARAKASEWGVTLLLKGAHTLVATPDGTVNVLPFKTSALATAGTGDVLAGMIAALRAQRIGASEAAAAAAYIHGLAGVKAAQQLGSERAVCASDVINAITAALAALNC